jgi:hypothetical protein
MATAPAGGAAIALRHGLGNAVHSLNAGASRATAHS